MRVLFVCDPGARSDLIETLRARVSAEIIPARSTEEFPDLEASGITLAVVDAADPGVDAAAAAERIREARGDEPLPILFRGCEGADDSFVESVVLVADLHRRARASELRAAESEARFRLMFENAREYAIFSLDPSGRLASWNTGAARLLGYGEAEVLGHEGKLLFTPEDIANGVPELEMKTALETGKAADERWHVRKDGSRFWASGVLSAIRNEAGLVGFVKIMRDYTEREEARQALQRSEERFRRLVEEVRDYAIYMIDPHGVISSWNKGGERITGFRTEDVMGRHFSMLFTAEDAAEGKPGQEMRAAAERGRNEAVGLRSRKDGSAFWGHEVLSAMRDADGGLTGFTKVTRDVSQQVGSEQLRRDQMRYLEGMSELSRVLEQDLDMERVLQLAMEKLLEIFRCHRAFLVHPMGTDEPVFRLPFQAKKPGLSGLPTGKDIPMDPFNIEVARRALASAEPLVIDSLTPVPGLEEYRQRYQLHTLMAMALRVKHGKPWCLGLHQCEPGLAWSENDRRLFKDITHRLTGVLDNLLMHRDLKASESRLEVILRNITDGILVYNAQGQVEYANEAAARLLGMPDSEQAVHLANGRRSMQGTGEIELTDESGRPIPAGQTPSDLALRGQEAPPAVIHFRMPGSGIDKWVVVTAKPIYDPDGRVAMVVTVVKDTTELRKTEDLYRQSQKMEAIGRLAGGVAHDFNNLLTAINGYSELLLDQTGPEDPRRPHIEEIRKAGERAAALTNQLLVYSRKQIVAPKTFDVNPIVAQMESMLRRLIGEDIDLRVRLDPRPLLIRADSGQIEQILLNLAVNAREAMPQGGRLTIRTGLEERGAGPDLSRGTYRPGPHVLLEVRDTGTGMSQEVLEHLFEPFFSTKETGTGLGLSTVYGIIEQSRGHIEVESRRGEGSAFRIYLPWVGDRKGEPGERPPHEEAVKRGKETILLAEDDAAVRKLAKSTLESLGYEVLDASDGVEALKLVRPRQGGIELLLTDVIMGQMGGRELHDRLIAMIPGLKTLYMSGYTDDAVLRNGVMGENDHFIQKPFTPAALARKVREVLDVIALKKR